jgi:hypothetical protein
MTLISVADLALTGGDFRRAAELADEALSLGAEALDPANRAIGLVNLATAEFRQGETDAASAHVGEALGLVVELGELDLVAHCLELIAVMGRDAGVSAQLLGVAVALGAKVEAVPNATERAVLDTAEADRRDKLGAALYEAARRKDSRCPPRWPSSSRTEASAETVVLPSSRPRARPGALAFHVSDVA